LDGRKQPIRGLWIRGTRYYARLNIENPLTGIKKKQRVPLVTKEGIPVLTNTRRAIWILSAVVREPKSWERWRKKKRS
jgi:hypothetical protein